MSEKYQIDAFELFLRNIFTNLVEEEIPVYKLKGFSSLSKKEQDLIDNLKQEHYLIGLFIYYIMFRLKSSSEIYRKYFKSKEDNDSRQTTAFLQFFFLELNYFYTLKIIIEKYKFHTNNSDVKLILNISNIYFQIIQHLLNSLQSLNIKHFNINRENIIQAIENITVYKTENEKINIKRKLNHFYKMFFSNLKKIDFESYNDIFEVIKNTVLQQFSDIKQKKIEDKKNEKNNLIFLSNSPDVIYTSKFLDIENIISVNILNLLAEKNPKENSVYLENYRIINLFYFYYKNNSETRNVLNNYFVKQLFAKNLLFENEALFSLSDDKTIKLNFNKEISIAYNQQVLKKREVEKFLNEQLKKIKKDMKSPKDLKDTLSFIISQIKSFFYEKDLENFLIIDNDRKISSKLQIELSSVLLKSYFNNNLYEEQETAVLDEETTEETEIKTECNNIKNIYNKEGDNI
jgi:hypothetical protein